MNPKLQTPNPKLQTAHSYLHYQLMRNLSLSTENELLHDLRAGDEDAFTEIYKRYWEKLLAIAYYHSRDKQTAEDIVHEVMISLWIRKKELQIQSLEAYLATAIKFAVFKFIVRDKRQRELLAGRQTEADERIEDKLEIKFLEEYLHGIVERLPEKARIVFKLSRTEDLSIKEIAGKIDLSPKAVEYHMTRALRTVKEAFRKIKMFFV
ncbi:MAG: RNA polymerase sigma-70 factor [Flavisolibacter sp.]